MVKLSVNGETHEVDADPATPLVYVLRNRLGLVGTKLGCGLEQCGSCAVLVDGEKVLSCNRAVAEFEGAQITTVEALGAERVGRAIQQAFIRGNAAQCGYCTTGIVVATTALLRANPRPDRSEVAAALDEHLCRCGSHASVLRAIDAVIEGGADGVQS